YGDYQTGTHRKLSDLGVLPAILHALGAVSDRCRLSCGLYAGFRDTWSFDGSNGKGEQREADEHSDMLPESRLSSKEDTVSSRRARTLAALLTTSFLSCVNISNMV